MKSYVLAAAAAVAAVGTIFTATAVAAPPPSHGAGSAAQPAVRGTHNTAVASDTGVVTPTAYNNGCGSGYTVRKTMPVTGGNVYLTYNSSTGYNCVVTVRNSSGSAVYMDTGVKKSGSSTWSYDAGQYKTYAGPIYVYGAGSCVDWYGTIGSSRQVKYDDACG